MRKLFYLLMVASILLLALAGCEELPENKQTPTVKVNASTAYPSGGKTLAPSSGYPVSTTTGGGAYPAPGSPMLFQIAKADNSTFAFTKAVYDKLTKVKVTIDGKDVTGVKLLDVLKEANITSFTKITLGGSNGKVELEAGQVDDKLILTLGESVVIQSPSLGSDKWIKDISLFKVN